MNHQGKIFKMILAGIFLGGAIFFSWPAIALEGIISGSVRDHFDNQGIQWVIITVKDDATGKLSATGITDVSGNYSIGIPVLGRYRLEASKSRVHVPWIRTVCGPELLGVAPLHQCGQLSLGNGRGDHGSFHQ